MIVVVVVVVGCGGQKNVARRFLKKRGHEKPITLFLICDSGRWQSPIGHHRAHQSIYLLLLTSQAFAVSPMSSTKAEEQKSSSNPLLFS